MPRWLIRYVGTSPITLLAAVFAVDLSAAAVDFNREVRPILSDKCFHCHGPDATTREADLRLDDESAIKADRDGMFVVKPGDTEASELIERITSSDNDLVMPPVHTNKPLTEREIDTLRQWVADGAAWSQHWAYVPPARHDLPAVNASSWPMNEIDNFILANLERQDIAPAPDADQTTLLRRLCFDLTGLPPSEKIPNHYLSASDGAAYDQLVDQLLSSPHFGERMAMYWLDLVRYADTVGYHGDQDHAISPYRDWVIDAFNNNLPFDQFTREQLAGDLLPAPSTQQIVATGYNRLLQTTHEGGLQAKEYRAIYAADRVRNVSAVWMGATVGCAQCHDHKFDPYTARDFYSLAAFFADVDDESHFTTGTNTLPARRNPELELPTTAQSQQMAALEQQRSDLKAVVAEKGSSKSAKALATNDLKAVETKLKSLRSQIRRTMITVALEEPRIVRVQARGNWMDESGPIVQPAVPGFLGTTSGGDRRATRLDLANWFVDTQDGMGLLTARVMANRLWFLCFGSGLAPDLHDFGGQGAPPTHPKLLDYLAHFLVDSGWDVKATLKFIVTSRTYRQSSAVRHGLQTIDPMNRLYAAQSSFRLPAESVRDNALAISGLLVTDIGGPSVKPYQPAGYYRHLNFPTRKYKFDNNSGQWRRGVYVHWQRQFLHPMLKAFDAPSREECTAERPRSNTPLAALALMNDPTFVEAAKALAARSLAVDLPTDDTRIDWVFQQAVTRSPTAAEQSVLQILLEENRTSFGGREAAAAGLLSVGLTKPASLFEPVELAAWTEVCRAVLNLAETNTRN